MPGEIRFTFSDSTTIKETGLRASAPRLSLISSIEPVWSRGADAARSQRSYRESSSCFGRTGFAQEA
jgi:hypothetical protein